MKMPSKDATVAAVAHQIASVLVILPVLVVIWTGAAYFGVELPRPAWQDDLQDSACQTARLNVEVFNRKLKREEASRTRLSDLGDALPPDDRAARWANRLDLERVDKSIRNLRGIVEPAEILEQECYG